MPKKNSNVTEVGSRCSLLTNSLHILLGRIITTTVSLISVPIVVEKLDIIGYGTWESIIAVSVMATVFQSTISGTLLWKISAAYGMEDWESVRKYVGTGLFFSLLFFSVVTPLAWLWNGALIHLFQVPSQFRDTALIVLPCVVGLMVLGSVNEVIATLIQGFQRAGVVTLIKAASLTSNNVAVIVGLFFGLGFWSLLIGFVVGFVIDGACLFLAARSIFSGFSLAPCLPRHAILSGTGAYAGFMLLGTVSMALRDQVDKIILSSVASPVWTGYYGIATRLGSLLLMICSFIYLPTLAAAGAMQSRGDGQGVRRLYTDVMTVMAVIVGLFSALLSGLYDRLIIFWVGKPIPEVGIILYFIIAGNVVAILLAGTGSCICKGIGIVGIETIYIIVGLVLNVILKVIMVPWMGALGTVISSAGSWALASALFIVLLHKQTDFPLAATIRGIKGLLIGGACAFCGRWLSNLIPLEVTRLGALGSMAGLSTVITTLFFGLMIVSRAIPVSAISLTARAFKTRFASAFRT